MAHGQRWKENTTFTWLNLEVNPISCHVKGPDGKFIHEGTAPASMKLFDYFMWMFPRETSSQLDDYMEIQNAPFGISI